MLETKRLILRKWTETNADSLFEYAKNPDVGPIAGWPPHKSVAESLGVIRNVLNGKECYAICEKGISFWERTWTCLDEKRNQHRRSFRLTQARRKRSSAAVSAIGSRWQALKTCGQEDLRKSV